jgi:DNA-binding MarR family transcriptional regulator
MPNSREEARLRNDAERLADIFTTLQRSFIIALSKELGRGNVSFPQYCLLGFLSQQKQLTMTEIANRMGHTTAAATGLVDRLEKLNHVRRVHAKDDRRKIYVQITASGAALVTEVRDDMVKSLLKIMAVLDPEERDMWLRIYEKVITFCQENCPIK